MKLVLLYPVQGPGESWKTTGNVLYQPCVFVARDLQNRYKTACLLSASARRLLYVIGRIIFQAKVSYLGNLQMENCERKVLFYAGSQLVEASVQTYSISKMIPCNCIHLALYVREAENYDIICTNFDHCSQTLTRSPSFSSLKEAISEFVATNLRSEVHKIRSKNGRRLHIQLFYIFNCLG